MSRIMLAIGTALVPGRALAHPGDHSGPGIGLLHFISDPFHLAVIAGVVILAVILLRSASRKPEREQA